jgi:membrane peptidoglycan carboxypeptidase
MRPIDQAHGFATFAAGGQEREPFFVRKVTDSSGKVLLSRKSDGEAEQAVSEEVAHDVTYALTGVADYSRRTLDGGRQVAAKTGTQGLDDVNNSDAWIVGYTPSISTSVWIGTDKRDPIINSEGGIIYGSGLPGEIWQQFMNRVLEGTPNEPLPDSPLIEGDTGVSVALPEPPSSAAPPPSTSAAAPTSETPTPEPVEEPVETEATQTTTKSTSKSPTQTTTTSASPLVPDEPGTAAGGGNSGGTRSRTADGTG